MRRKIFGIATLQALVSLEAIVAHAALLRATWVGGIPMSIKVVDKFPVLDFQPCFLPRMQPTTHFPTPLATMRPQFRRKLSATSKSLTSNSVFLNLADA
jgi:hypothetical protein